MKLGQLAHARSGDKGNHANIGVIARSRADYPRLAAALTAERVASYFAGLGVTRVERFELPRIGGLNFLLYDALGGGASQRPHDPGTHLFGQHRQDVVAHPHA